MVLGTRALLIKQRTMLINAIRGHAAELGITGSLGSAQARPLLDRIATHPGVPSLAREVFVRLAAQLESLDQEITTLDGQLRAWHRGNAVSRRLATIPSIGPIGATALVMKVPDPAVFTSGRHFAAWIGLTPKDHSTAGRQRLGGITCAGDEELRALLVSGAMAVIQHAKAGKTSPWLLELLARKPKKLAAVALANKTARIAWAMMMRGGSYQPPASA
jgi:transposase